MKTLTHTLRVTILVGPIAALLTLAAPSAFADVISSSADLRLLSGDPDVGDPLYLSLYNDGGGNVQRTFLNFNLSSYSGKSATTDATLTLVALNFGQFLTGASLGTANSAWTQGGITWNNQPGLTAISGATNPGGNFANGSNVTWTIPWYMVEKLATTGSGYNNGLGMTSGAGSTLHFQSTGGGGNPTLTLSAATAASSTWTGGDGNWTDTANWAGGTMAQGIDQAATINGGTAVNITMDSNRSVGSLSFSGADHTISAGAGKLALNVTTGAPTISVETGRTAIIGATLVGIDGLTKTSDGTLTLSLASAYTGATTINGGTLKLTVPNNNGFGTIANAGNITVNSGGTLLGSAFNALGYGNTHAGDLLTINKGGALRVDAGIVLSMPYALNVVGGTISSVDGGDPSFGSIFYGSTQGTFTSHSDGTAATISAQNFALQGAQFNVVQGGGAVDLNVTGNLIGGQPLVKNGNGVMALTNANTYGGATIINDGTLKVTFSGNNNGGVGTIGVGSGITVNSGATLLGSAFNGLGYGNTHGGDLLTINKGGALRVDAGIVLSMPYALNVVGGTISSVDGGDPGFGTIYYQSTQGTFTSHSDGTAATISAQRFNLQGAQFNVVQGGGAVDLNVTGNLIGGPLTKNGNGVMALAGANSYGGQTNITAGTLVAANNTALGVGGHNGDTMTFIQDGATLAMQGGISLDEHFHVWGSGVGGLGAVRSISGNNALTNAPGGAPGYALRSNTTVGVDADTLTVSGFYNGDAGSYGLNKIGAGTLTLTAANAYTGATIIDNGTLKVTFNGGGNGGVGTLGVGSGITVNSGGTLLGSAFNGLGFAGTHADDLLTINKGGALRVDAGVVLSMPYALNVVGGTISSVDGGDPGFGTIFYGSTQGTFTSHSDGTAATISAQNFGLRGAQFNVVQGGGPVDLNVTGNLTVGALVKNGNGTMVLSNSNTYTGGTIVNAGRLLINGTISGGVSVNGGTLGGSGTTTGAVTLATGGTIAPGSSIGTLNTGTLAFTGGAFGLEIDTTAITSDLANVTGDLNLLGGGTLSITDFNVSSTPLTLGQVFTFIDYSSIWDGGVFTGYTDDSQFTLGLNEYRISYNGVDNATSAVTLQVVPEPGSAVLLIGGLAAIVGLRRRRSHEVR